MTQVSHFIYTWFGVGGGPPNTAYSFWSGVGGCLVYLGALGALYKHFSCAVPGCYWPGHRMLDKHKVCAKHHPEGRLTKHHILGTLVEKVASDEDKPKSEQEVLEQIEGMPTDAERLEKTVVKAIKKAAAPAKKAPAKRAAPKKKP